MRASSAGAAASAIRGSALCANRADSSLDRQARRPCVSAARTLPVSAGCTHQAACPVSGRTLTRSGHTLGAQGNVSSGMLFAPQAHTWM